ncbi:MAG: DUF4147 domain-containing protein [Ignavibacteriales bacterium]|nr:DUF4147 domain-containing protein [Ignavibacteriales bacterium]
MNKEVKKLKTTLKKIFFDALKKHDPATLVFNALKNDKLLYDQYKKIEVVSIGKSANGMAQGAAKYLKERITRGLIISNISSTVIPERFSFLLSTHPYPDQKSLTAGQALIDFCKTTDPDSLLLFLISGGTSAMAAVPVDGISIELKSNLTGVLQRGGIGIEELNFVRKSLSKIKGGKLLNYIKSKKIVNLLISDVPGNDISTIGSGLLFPEKTNRKKLISILKNAAYHDDSGIVEEVLFSLPKNLTGAGIVRQELVHKIIDSNDRFLGTVSELGEKRGFDTMVLKEPVTGEVRFVSSKLFMIVETFFGDFSANKEKPTLVIAGGETTVRVNGEGRGGRNCEMAMRFALFIEYKKYVILTAGTDGIDGNSDLAGGIVDGFTMSRSTSPDFVRKLASNDSGEWLLSCGAAVKTGSTGINLADLYLICRY